jgi:parvulin-like peptidyl-prolyl isomerase
MPLNRPIAIAAVGLLLLSSCAPKEDGVSGHGASLANPNTLTSDPSAPPPPAINTVSGPSKTLATVNGQPITTEMMLGPLTEAYGLQFVLHLAQLELAKQKAKEVGVTVSSVDIAAERRITLETTFKETIETDGLKMTEIEKQNYRQQKYEELLEKLLETKRISQPEFRLAMETGAYLRKVAEAQVKGRVSEEEVEKAFRIKYGERVRVRQIQLSNVREAAEVLRRLGAQEPFEKVAQEMSRDEKSRANGGAIRAFSRAEPMWPAAFVEAAFDLKKPGDLSGMVTTGEAVHIIRLEEKIPPNKAVKFEDYRDSLREELYSLITQYRMKQLREEIVFDAGRLLKIEDPMLRRQYIDRMASAAGETPRDPAMIRRDLEAERPRPATTRSAATKPENDRPPATKPGK